MPSHTFELRGEEEGVFPREEEEEQEQEEKSSRTVPLVPMILGMTHRLKKDEITKRGRKRITTTKWREWKIANNDTSNKEERHCEKRIDSSS